MDIVARDAGTDRIVELLDSFKVRGSGKEVQLIYDNYTAFRYVVKCGYELKCFFALFFARRYFNRLKEKYGGAQ